MAARPCGSAQNPPAAASKEPVLGTATTGRTAPPASTPCHNLARPGHRVGAGLRRRRVVGQRQLAHLVAGDLVEVGPRKAVAATDPLDPLLAGPVRRQRPDAGSKDGPQTGLPRAGAAGAYNQHFRRSGGEPRPVWPRKHDPASRLGVQRRLVRVAGQGKTAAFAEYWRQIVKTNAGRPRGIGGSSSSAGTRRWETSSSRPTRPGRGRVRGLCRGRRLTARPGTSDTYPWPADATRRGDRAATEEGVGGVDHLQPAGVGVLDEVRQGPPEAAGDSGVGAGLVPITSMAGWTIRTSSSGCMPS